MQRRHLRARNTYKRRDGTRNQSTAANLKCSLHAQLLHFHDMKWLSPVLTPLLSLSHMPISTKLAFTFELTDSSLHQQAGFCLVTFIAMSQGLTNGHLVLYCKSGSSTEIPRSYRGTLIMDARPRTSRFIHELVMPYRQERRQEAPSEQTSMGTIIT